MSVWKFSLVCEKFGTKTFVFESKLFSYRRLFCFRVKLFSYRRLYIEDFLFSTRNLFHIEVFSFFFRKCFSISNLRKCRIPLLWLRKVNVLITTQQVTFGLRTSDSLFIFLPYFWYFILTALSACHRLAVKIHFSK